jgi:hypothetical protein
MGVPADSESVIATRWRGARFLDMKLLKSLAVSPFYQLVLYSFLSTKV